MSPWFIDMSASPWSSETAVIAMLSFHPSALPLALNMLSMGRVLLLDTRGAAAVTLC